MKKKPERLYVPDMPENEGRDLDWSKAGRVRLSNVKPSTETISLRMPASLLQTIKIEASKRDVTYQSLIKITLAEKFPGT